MNLFQFGEHLDVKQEDINSAFILAIRIMFGKESLDFEIDTRGKLPKSIKTFFLYSTDKKIIESLEIDFEKFRK